MADNKILKTKKIKYLKDINSKINKVEESEKDVYIRYIKNLIRLMVIQE